MISFTQKGSFNNTERYFKRLKSSEIFSILNRYGEIGVAALSSATPTDTGETASSWYYEINQKPGHYSIRWGNRNNENGAPIAILLQYGHGTGTGGYVHGRDYIMPAIRPVFDQMLADAIKEVTR